jgi:HlyD family secretion protein
VVVELISEDAAKVRAGDRARITNWGGARALSARVRRVEPSGFTKLSALGVEEQRVNVLLDLTDPPQKRMDMADGYRVTAHIVIWQNAKVLRVPAAALFRNGDGWSVFRLVGGRARLTPVQTGHSDDNFAQVIRGLRDGDLVILHPSDRVHDGVRVR